MAEAVGVLLRDLRLSVRQVAERAGIGKSTVSYWEAGSFQPRLPELDAVLHALDASPAERARALALVDAPSPEAVPGAGRRDAQPLGAGRGHAAS